MRNRSHLVAAIGLVTVCGIAFENVVNAQDRLEYNRDIRPILAENCFACHGADSASRKADLRLDKRDVAIEFGAITEGQPDESELVARITSDDPELLMPPPETKKSLTPQEIETLRQWIAAGAEYQPHWSFIAPVKPEIPQVSNKSWLKNEIDSFILARLEEHQLQPAAEADSRTLFRRLHLDITGLPPTPESIAQFATDYETNADAAVSSWIDRLMQSPAWGEHRARYWLDAARYGDTHGLHFDNYREMWPYRDWVIRSFNHNQPYDQFTVEQLAGDLLPDPTEDQLIATGFQRCNITTNEGGTIDEENLANYAVDRVQTFGWVHLGMTTNCAQCHDHKFDPFTQKDFYSLAAFFRNTTQGPKDGNVKDGLGPILVLPVEADRPRWDALPGDIAAAKTVRDEYKTAARTPFDEWVRSVSIESLAESLPHDDLVIHLPLDEGSGKEIHSAGDVSQTFTANGDVTWSDAGKIGSAPVIKPGSTFDLGNVGDFELHQSFSYGAWVKTANTDTSAAIFAKMDEKAAFRGWDLWQNGNAFSVHIIDSWPENSMKVTTKNAVVKAGQWQHLMMTYDGSRKPEGVRIYVNGKEQPTKVDNKTFKDGASIKTQTHLRIGQRSEGAILDGGSVQDIRIFQRQLTDGEVQTIARFAPLQAILSIEEEKRKPQQTEQLFDHYLTNIDTRFTGLVETVDQLEAEQKAIRDRSPVTHIQQEKMNSPAMAYILTRGEYDRPTQEVTAATPAALHPFAEELPHNRLGLAKWLIDPANPLTARVTVNRFWQQIFGRGIVVTPEDFGVTGALPSHPELLDWLAIDFREHGWDVQRFFKQVFMSATYRQASITTPEKLERDRENMLLSRGPRFRMDAEMIRDSALASSGLLSRKMYGPGVKPYQPEGIWDIVGLPSSNTRNYVQDTGEDLYRRTLYTFWKRMAPPPDLEALNAPSREFCTVRRERTNTPLQALVTLNDPQFVEAARHLAQQVISTQSDDTAILNQVAVRVLGRDFSAYEQDSLRSDYVDYLKYYREHPEDAQALINVGESQVPEGLDPASLAAWTLVCNQVMNLDEAVNK